MNSFSLVSYKTHTLAYPRPLHLLLAHLDFGTFKSTGKSKQKRWFAHFPNLLCVMLKPQVVCRDKCGHHDNPVVGHDWDMDEQAGLS
jgi:hypothetical protein